LTHLGEVERVYVDVCLVDQKISHELFTVDQLLVIFLKDYNLLLNQIVCESFKITNLVSDVVVQEVVMLPEKLLYREVCICNTSSNKVLKFLENLALSNPVYRINIFRVTLVPVFPYNLVPFLQGVHIVSKLIIFGPFLYHLN
jgi:hypothetical protein